MNTRFAVNTKGISLLATTLILMATAGQAQASIWYVPKDYKTIQGAIDHARNGDTIVVSNAAPYGIYRGVGNRDINFKGKAIRLQSSNRSEPLYIDCQGSGRGFYFGNKETSATIVNGFTIMNASAYYGGGILCENGSNPTIAYCNVYNSRATAGDGVGGGVQIVNSSPTVTGCYFQGNTARYGGAVSVSNGSPNFTNCTFILNTSTLYGGGVYNNNQFTTASPTFTGCSFSSNTASTDGGGMYNIYCSPILKDCSFASNTANEGGGMSNRNSNPTISNTSFLVNSAGMNGGGIRQYNGKLTILQCSFTANNTQGPAATFYKGYGSAIDCINSALIITGSSFELNKASTTGAITCSDSATTITGCLIKRNQASVDSGGVWMYEGGTRVINTVIAENTNSGISAHEGNLTVMNSTITRNYGYGVYFYTNDSTFVNSILWGNTDKDLAAGGPSNSGVSNSVLGTMAADESYHLPAVAYNINADPLFVNAPAGDYRLKAGSPAINKGDNSLLLTIFPGTTTDLAGNARIRGGVVDMGAYEY